MKCLYCGIDMGSKDDHGCLYTHIRFTPIIKEESNSDSNYTIRTRTIVAPRVKVGAENDMFTYEDYKNMGRERCPDCAAPIGGCHHINCDNERCPRCGRQLISCDCYDEYEIEQFQKLFN